jgi:DNA-binding transcriptional MerR regulator/effector-binding domain-containing protein
MFTIGPFARLAGVSAKVLRSYDGLGLFRPVWVDPSTDYRYYSPAQLPELRRIVSLREMGIGLAEIGRLVSGGADLRSALDRRRVELERERREIDRRLATLDIRVEMSAAGSPQPDIVIRPLAADAVATLAMADRDDDDVGAAFYELEAFIRDVRRRAHRPPGALIGLDGAVEIFVPVTRPIDPSGRVAFRRLPACRAATVIVRGSYDLVREGRGALERWVEAAGLHRTGPLRIIYLQFGAEPELRLPRGYLVEQDADLVTEVQLPVA